MAVRQTFGWKRVRVGLLVAVGIFLLGYAVYRVGRIFDVFAKRYTLVTALPSVAGLREGAPVSVAGQRVGQVSRIEFIPMQQKRGDDNLILELRIAQNVRDQIRADSRAYLRPMGLLGDKYIDITAGTASAVALQEGDTIVAEAALDIDQFLARGGALLDSAGGAVRDVRRITMGLKHGQGTLGQLLTNEQLYARMVTTTGELQTTLEQFRNPNGTVGRMMRDPALYNQLVAAAVRVDSLGRALTNGNGTLGRLLNSDDLYHTLFRGASRADSALGSLNGLMGRMADNGGGTVQKLMTDPQLYDAFLKAVVDLQTLIADMRANPKRFVPDVNVKVF